MWFISGLEKKGLHVSSFISQSIKNSCNQACKIYKKEYSNVDRAVLGRGRGQVISTII